MDRRMLFGILFAGICAIAVGAYFLAPIDSDEPDRGSASAPASYEAPFGLAISDYEPVGSPKAVAERVERAPGGGVVVRGEVVDYASGRTYLVAPPSHTAVMTLSVLDVYRGNLPKDAQSKVYVELDAPSESTMNGYLSRARAETPPGTEGVFYLWSMPEDGVYPGSDQVGSSAGRPVGQPLYRPIPQGVYIALPDSVLAPADELEFEGATLSEFEPSRTGFPPATGR